MIQMTTANITKLVKNKRNTFHNTFDFNKEV